MRCFPIPFAHRSRHTFRGSASRSPPKPNPPSANASPNRTPIGHAVRGFAGSHVRSAPAFLAKSVIRSRSRRSVCLGTSNQRTSRTHLRDLASGKGVGFGDLTSSSHRTEAAGRDNGGADWDLADTHRQCLDPNEYGGRAFVRGDGVAFVNFHSTRAGPEPRRPSGAPSVVHRRAQQVPANREAHRVGRTISDKFTKATPSPPAKKAKAPDTPEALRAPLRIRVSALRGPIPRYLTGGGTAIVMPWRRKTSIIFARSGGPGAAAPMTSAASRK